MAAAPSDITVVLGKFEEELTCPICREILKEPKSLPCLHSFCQGCLVEYARLRPLGDGGEGEAPPPEARDVIPCPKCKFQAQLDPVGGQGEPGNVVASLKTNHCLKNLVRHYKILQEVVGDRRTKCGFCSVVDNEAVAFCQTGCNQFLCQPCLGSHKRMTLSSDHKIVSLDDVRSNGSLDAENARVAMAYRTRKCGEHFVEGRDDPNERMTDMTIYCFQCSKVICCMCAIIDHQPHNPKKIASSVIDEPDHRPLIKKKVSEAEEVMNKKLYISSVKLHERQFHIEHARSNTEQRIKEDFQRLNTGLERERDSLLRRIDNIYQYHLRHLREQRKALDDKRKAIERTLKFVDRRLTLGSAEDVVQFGKEMTRQISQLVAEARETPPEGAYKRVVRFAEEDQNMAGVMGNVSAEPHVEIFTADDIQNVEFVRNEESEFTITARDVLRDEATTDDEMLFIELQPVGQPAEQVVPAEVKKLKNGKCLVTVKPQKTGDHTLSIQVARAGKYQHIHNSPFPVVVAINHAVNLYEV